MLSSVPSAGVDVGQQYLDLGFFPFAKPMRVTNTQEEIDKIISTPRQKGATKVALEAIGSYAHRLVCELSEAGFQVFVVNPRRIKAFRDAEGLIAKTDRLDAALIARFAHKMSQDLRPLPDAELLTLKALSTRRRQLTELVALALVQIPWMAAKLSVGVHWRIRQQAPRSTSLARFCPALEAYPMRTGLS